MLSLFVYNLNRQTVQIRKWSVVILSNLDVVNEGLPDFEGIISKQKNLKGRPNRVVGQRFGPVKFVSSTFGTLNKLR